MPAPAQSDLQWIELVDFSQGVFGNNELAGGVQVTSTNPAIAQTTNTYRCRSLPTGGLGPLPRRQENFALTDPPGSDANASYRVCGFNTWGNVLTVDVTETDQTTRVEIHMALDYYEPSTDDRFLAWVRERIFDTTPTTEVLLSRSFLNVGNGGTARYAYFLKTRMLLSVPTNPGQPVMVLIWALNPIGGSDDNRISRAHPNPTTPTSNTPVVVGAETEAYTAAVAHQGRIALGKFLAYNRGVDTILFTNDNLVWTNVNLNTLSTTVEAVIVPEVDQTISDIASMSANTLLVIKDLGGGYVLQGDLDDLTVVRLPNIISPDGGQVVRGCNTPIGYVYSAGDAGLYVWNGGDASEPISNQLDGQFATSDITRDGANGQCDRWGDLLLVPRNWVMDLTSKGWWRIEDPDDFEVRFWSTAAFDSQTYGAPESFTPTGTAFALWERDDLAYSWSWQSHPLWVSRDHYLDTRHAIVAVQGHGSVTITLVNEDGDTDVNIIAVDSAVIRNVRFNTTLQAENLQIRIEAEGHVDPDDTAATSEAPLVHRLFVAYKEASHLALTDTG